MVLKEQSNTVYLFQKLREKTEFNRKDSGIIFEENNPSVQ